MKEIFENKNFNSGDLISYFSDSTIFTFLTSLFLFFNNKLKSELYPILLKVLPFPRINNTKHYKNEKKLFLSCNLTDYYMMLFPSADSSFSMI